MKISPLYWQNITLFVVAVAVEADKHGNDDCFIFITYSISQSCCCWIPGVEAVEGGLFFHKYKQKQTFETPFSSFLRFTWYNGN